MQTYVLLTKLSPDVTRQMKDRAKLGLTLDGPGQGKRFVELTHEI